MPLVSSERYRGITYEIWREKYSDRTFSMPLKNDGLEYFNYRTFFTGGPDAGKLIDRLDGLTRSDYKGFEVEEDCVDQMKADVDSDMA